MIRFIEEHYREDISAADLSERFGLRLSYLALDKKRYQDMVLSLCHRMNLTIPDSQILVEAWSPLGRQRLADDPLLAELAGKYGVSQAQICLRFALDCGVVPLPKSADAGRMRQNLALDFALEAEDLERLRTMPQTGWSGLHPDK